MIPLVALQAIKGFLPRHPILLESPPRLPEFQTK
jgi:hypothetical protein